VIILVWDEIPHIIEISCSNRILFSSDEKLLSSYTSFNATSSHPNFYHFLIHWFFYLFYFQINYSKKRKENEKKEKKKSNNKKKKEKRKRDLFQRIIQNDTFINGSTTTTSNLLFFSYLIQIINFHKSWHWHFKLSVHQCHISNWFFGENKNKKCYWYEKEINNKKIKNKKIK